MQTMSTKNYSDDDMDNDNGDSRECDKQNQLKEWLVRMCDSRNKARGWYGMW
jgi:hypothetical protein